MRHAKNYFRIKNTKEIQKPIETALRKLRLWAQWTEACKLAASNMLKELTETSVKNNREM